MGEDKDGPPVQPSPFPQRCTPPRSPNRSPRASPPTPLMYAALMAEEVVLVLLGRALPSSPALLPGRHCFDLLFLSAVRLLNTSLRLLMGVQTILKFSSQVLLFPSLFTSRKQYHFSEPAAPLRLSLLTPVVPAAVPTLERFSDHR